MFGGVLWLASGGVGMSLHRFVYRARFDFPLALGLAAIAAAVVFLVDFAFAVKRSMEDVAQPRTIY